MNNVPTKYSPGSGLSRSEFSLCFFFLLDLLLALDLAMANVAAGFRLSGGSVKIDGKGGKAVGVTQQMVTVTGSR